MKRRRPAPPRTYTLIDELAASPTEPMPAAFRTHQLTRMWLGLSAMEKEPSPTADDWRVVSDAVNLLETLVEMQVLEDAQGLLPEAVEALALAGRRSLKGNALRLDGRGMQAVRAILEDYAAALNALPARVMVRAHRRTEARILEIRKNKRRPHDVEIVSL